MNQHNVKTGVVFLKYKILSFSYYCSNTKHQIHLKQEILNRALIFGLLITCIISQNQVHSQSQARIDSLAMIENPREKMRMAIMIANDLQFDDWNRTIHYLNIAEKAANEIGTNSALSEFNFEAGSIYQTKGLIDIALDYYIKAYDLYDGRDNPIAKYRIENNLGILYARRNNVKKTLEYFNKVLAYKELKTEPRVQILNNIGNFLANNDLPDSAVVYLKRAEKGASELNDLELSSFVITNLARAYATIPNNSLAVYHFNRAIKMAREDLSARSKSWIYVAAAEYYSKIHEPDSAIKYANLAFDVLSIRPRADYIKSASEAMYLALIETGAYEKASVYFQKYDSARNEIKAVEEDVSMDRLKLAQEYQEQLRIKNLEASQRRFKLIITGLIIALALILVSALALRYRAKLKNAKLQNQLTEARRQELRSKLELKEKELISGTMQEIAKTSFINEVSDELKKLKLKANKKETRDHIDTILQKIIREQRTDIWKEFDTHFTEIHESFYRILSQKHHELTTRDLRLCALLKLNLSSKEVADLTGQSVKGIENARVRLRKKLELTNTGSEIASYLNSLA